jgi:tetratricopeptide (TPR) repeat protein
LRSLALVPSICAALLLPAAVYAATCTAPACVEAIEIDGQRAPQVEGVVLQGGGDPRERKATLAEGAQLAVGTVIETPTRPRVRLQLVTRNGNAVTLDPGARLRIESVGENGERWTQQLGGVRFAVNRALGYFEVAHDRFLAAVKGTEFTVAIDQAQQEIRYDWRSGEVVVEQEIGVAIAEQDSDDNDDADDTGTAATMIQREVLSAKQPQLRYRLDPVQYIRRFKTYRDAEQFFRDQAAEDAKSGDPRQALRGQMQLAAILNIVGKSQPAVDVLQRALDEAARQGRPRLESQAALQLGSVYVGMKKYDLAVPMMKRSLAIEEKLEPAGASPGIASAWIALGRAQGYAGDPKAWVASIERAMQIYRQIYPDENTQRGAALHKNFADALWAAGERERALREYDTALAIKKKVWGDRNTWPLANGYQDLGRRNLQLGRTDVAITHLQKALEVRSALFKGVHPSVANALDDLGRAYQRAGDRDRARSYYQQALDLRQQLFPDGHPSIVRSYRALARVARDGGDEKTAKEYEAEAAALARARGGAK